MWIVHIKDAGDNGTGTKDQDISKLIKYK